MKLKIRFLGLILILSSGCGSAAEPTATTLAIATNTITIAPIASETFTPTKTPLPATKVCSPLTDHALGDLRKYLSQPFSAPLGENKEQGHHGVDFAYYHRDEIITAPPLEGNPIQSVLNGIMAGLGYNDVYGNYLIVETGFEILPADLAALYPIEPGQSIYLLYAHMQDLAPFEIREPLDCAQVIGYVGDSGSQFFVSDPHLHLETRVGPSGIFIEPMAYYSTQATEEERSEYLYWRTSDVFTLFDPMILLEYGAQVEVING